MNGSACLVDRGFDASLHMHHDACERTDQHFFFPNSWGVLQVMFLRAYAMLGMPVGGACLKALAGQALKELPRFEPRHLSNMLWAWAKLKHRPDAVLLRGCEAHAARTATSFAPQDLVRWRHDTL